MKLKHRCKIFILAWHTKSEIPSNPLNKQGKAEAVLVGGDL
jgi:hypothetical protein